MQEELIAEVMQQMLAYIDNAQLKQLKQVLERVLFQYEIKENISALDTDDSNHLIEMFVAAKRIEGCSVKTLKYYRKTIDTMML